MESTSAARNCRIRHQASLEQELVLDLPHMASATGEKPLERANQLLSALRSQTSPPIKDLLWGHVKAGVAALLRHYGDDAYVHHYLDLRRFAYERGGFAD